MNLADAISPSDLAPARSIATRLAKVLHGLMSVGAASLAMEGTKNFLDDRDKSTLELIEALESIQLMPGHGNETSLLKEGVQELRESATRFHQRFDELSKWRSLPPQPVPGAVQRLQESYATFCLRLRDFCSMLGMNSSLDQQARQDNGYLDAVLQTIVPHTNS